MSLNVGTYLKRGHGCLSSIFKSGNFVKCFANESNLSIFFLQKKNYHLDFFLAGSGAIGLTQIDRYFNDDSITNMIQRIQSLSYHYEGRLQLHLIGGFSDSRRISHGLSISLLRK